MMPVTLFLRITTGPTPNLQQALANATVQLYELDNPAPAGDDVLIPPTGESEKINGKFEITEIREYTPAPDQLLGTGLTDENGVVKFVAATNSAGGTLRDTKTTMNVVTGQLISTHTATSPVIEKKPDYGVSITAAGGAPVAQRMLIALNAAGNLGSLNNPYPVRILTSVVTDPDPSMVVSTPVTSARKWTQALAPKTSGFPPEDRWNYITEIYELHSSFLPEWVVVDLTSGTARRYPGVAKVYANHAMKISNQLRASNGRIFFPCATNHIAYYEPADEQIHQLPVIVDPVNGATDNIIFSAVFGPDGKIYGATQSDYTAQHVYLPMVFQLHPDTLAIRVLGHVGKDRLTYSYGYYLQADPPWVYVAVGERPWELAALNIDTGEMRILAKLSGPAPWIKLSVDENAVIATLITDLGSEDHYVADGILYPNTAPGQFPTRNVTPYGNPLKRPPEIDDTDGAGHVSWRPSPQAAWTKIDYSVDNRVPIAISSMAALPDGSVIGDSEEYNGFWRYYPNTNTTKWYGPSPGIASQPELAVFDGRLYIAGYPNGGLFRYDWTMPWSKKPEQCGLGTNPCRLGDYHATSKMKYARQLVWGANGRLYAAGGRERDGQGSGIGYYDNQTGLFTGRFLTLSTLDPRGLTDIAGHIVFSGKVVDDPEHPGQTPAVAQLVIYDYDLNEIRRMAVKDGVLDTGQLFNVSDTVVMGVVASTKSIYLFDVSTATLKLWVDLDAELNAATQRVDGSVWLMLGSEITRIDPMTLERTTIGMLSAPASHLAWVGNDLYLSIGAELRVVRGVPQ